MFTLGDVSDILDSALDTGLDIVDVLNKLSDCADEGKLNREKCFQRLDLSDASSAENDIVSNEKTSSKGTDFIKRPVASSLPEDSSFVYNATTEQSVDDGCLHSRQYQRDNGRSGNGLVAHIQNNNSLQNEDQTSRLSTNKDRIKATTPWELKTTRVVEPYSHEISAHADVVDGNAISSTQSGDKADFPSRSVMATEELFNSISRHAASNEVKTPLTFQPRQQGGFSFQGLHGGDIMDALSELCSVADEIMKQNKSAESCSTSRLDAISEQRDGDSFCEQPLDEADDENVEQVSVQQERNESTSSKQGRATYKLTNGKSELLSERSNQRTTSGRSVSGSMFNDLDRQPCVMKNAETAPIVTDSDSKVHGSVIKPRNRVLDRPGTYLLNKECKTAISALDIPLDEINPDFPLKQNCQLKSLQTEFDLSTLATSPDDETELRPGTYVLDSSRDFRSLSMDTVLEVSGDSSCNLGEPTKKTHLTSTQEKSKSSKRRLSYDTIDALDCSWDGSNPASHEYKSKFSTKRRDTYILSTNPKQQHQEPDNVTHCGMRVDRRGTYVLPSTGVCEKTNRVPETGALRSPRRLARPDTFLVSLEQPHSKKQVTNDNKSNQMNNTIPASEPSSFLSNRPTTYVLSSGGSKEKTSGVSRSDVSRSPKGLARPDTFVLCAGESHGKKQSICNDSGAALDKSNSASEQDKHASCVLQSDCVKGDFDGLPRDVVVRSPKAFTRPDTFVLYAEESHNKEEAPYDDDISMKDRPNTYVLPMEKHEKDSRARSKALKSGSYVIAKPLLHAKGLSLDDESFVKAVNGKQRDGFQSHKRSVSFDQWPSAVDAQCSDDGIIGSQFASDDWLMSCNSMESFATNTTAPFSPSLEEQSDFIASSSFSDDIGVSQIFGCPMSQSELSLQPMKHERTQSYEDISPYKGLECSPGICLSASMPNFQSPCATASPPVAEVKTPPSKGINAESYIVSKSSNNDQHENDVAERLDSLYKYMSISLNKLHQLQRCQSEVLIYTDEIPDAESVSQSSDVNAHVNEDILLSQTASECLLASSDTSRSLSVSQNSEQPIYSFSGYSPVNQTLNESPFQLKRAGTYVVDIEKVSKHVPESEPGSDHTDLELPQILPGKPAARKPIKKFEIIKKKSPSSKSDKNRQPLTARLKMLKMKLEERRKHIESEKKKMESQWNDEMAKIGQTAFWFAIGNEKNECNGDTEESHSPASADTGSVSSTPSKSLTSSKMDVKGKSPAWEVSLDSTMDSDDRQLGRPSTAPTKSKKSPSGLMFVSLNDDNKKGNNDLHLDDFSKQRLRSPPMECSTPLRASQSKYSYGDSKTTDGMGNSSTSLPTDDISANNIGSSTPFVSSELSSAPEVSSPSSSEAPAEAIALHSHSSMEEDEPMKCQSAEEPLLLSQADKHHTVAQNDIDSNDSIIEQHHERKLWTDHGDSLPIPLLPKVTSSFIPEPSLSVEEVEEVVVEKHADLTEDDVAEIVLHDDPVVTEPGEDLSSDVISSCHDISPSNDSMLLSSVANNHANSEVTFLHNEKEAPAQHHQETLPKPILDSVTKATEKTSDIKSSPESMLGNTPQDNAALKSTSLQKSHVENAIVNQAENPGVEVSPSAKGMALFIGESEAADLGLTPEQIKKRDRFMKNRQKRQEEEKAKREAENERKARREMKKKERKANVGKGASKSQSTSEDSSLSRIPPTHDPFVSKQEDDLVSFHPVTQRPFSQPVTTKPFQTTTSLAQRLSDDLSSAQAVPQSQFSEYKGPSAYVRPSGKSNRKIMNNAIAHCCLSGEVNRPAKEKCLHELSQSQANHFLVLFRDGLKFRSLYSYAPDTEQVTKLYGIGPKLIASKMVEKLYKYNSGSKEFSLISAKSLSIQVDGMTIKKEYWQSNKTLSSKTDSNIRKNSASSKRN